MLVMETKPKYKRYHHKQKILRNAAQCAVCKKEITSTHVHDFAVCDCRDEEGKWEGSIGIFVDGGFDYLRRGGNFENFIDLAVCELIKIPCTECAYFSVSEQHVPYCYHDVRVNPPALPVILYGIGSNDTFEDCPMLLKEDEDA